MSERMASLVTIAGRLSTRELIVAKTRYIVPYRVRGETVEVLRVFDSSSPARAMVSRRALEPGTFNSTRSSSLPFRLADRHRSRGASAAALGVWNSQRVKFSAHGCGRRCCARHASAGSMKQSVEHPGSIE
jgi:hypothetical protein